ncbi:MAG: hypothetical protein WCQ21_31310, partial [Verrucomicrobiota bacterium]
MLLSDLVNVVWPIYAILAGLNIYFSSSLLAVLADDKYHGAVVFVMWGVLIEFFRCTANLWSYAAQIEGQTRKVILPYALATMVLWSGLVLFCGRDGGVESLPAVLVGAGAVACVSMVLQMQMVRPVKLDIWRWLVSTLALVMCLALLYLRAPDADRLVGLCLGAVLLAQSRYESAIYVLPVAAVVLAGWWRARAVLLPWGAVLTPLLLVPCAWHNRVLTATPRLWQLAEGQTSRFSFDYLRVNLAGAVHFLFNFGNTLANSWYLSVLGVAGLAWGLWTAGRWLRTRTPVAPAVLVTVLFGLGVAGNFVLVQFYYWSRLDDIVTSRFALPLTLMLALLAAAGVERLNRRWPVRRLAFLGVGVFLLVSGLPAIAYR